MYITGETHMYMLIHDNETQINVEHTEKACKQENRKVIVRDTHTIFTHKIYE